jgi:hypothetical protein
LSSLNHFTIPVGIAALPPMNLRAACGGSWCYLDPTPALLAGVNPRPDGAQNTR